MTSKQLLDEKIDSVLYWAEELKTLYAELEQEENPSFDSISWIASILADRSKEVREILKGI